MENATTFADAKNPNRRENHLKKIRKEIQKRKRITPAEVAQASADILVGDSPAAQRARYAVIKRLHLDVPDIIEIPNHRKGAVLIRDRRKGDRRAKAKTRMNFGAEVHTQWFDADKDKPAYEGRYKVKYNGAVRFVFRYWNPAEGKWQFNRRKAAIECQQPGAGDVWRGLAAKAGV